jgi:FMN reductase [NAD(P)H]
MPVSDIIARRKSIRAYLDRSVDPEIVDRVIEAGRWAPNHGDYHISLIRNAELRQRLNDRTLDAMAASGIPFLMERASLPGYWPLYGAPVVVLLSAPGSAPTSPLNCALPVENMLLEATANGLGSCFLYSVALVLKGEANRALAEEMGIPAGYDYQCGMLFGHAAPENKFSEGERAPRGTVTYFD